MKEEKENQDTELFVRNSISNQKNTPDQDTLIALDDFINSEGFKSKQMNSYLKEAKIWSSNYEYVMIFISYDCYTQFSICYSIESRTESYVVYNCKLKKIEKEGIFYSFFSYPEQDIVCPEGLNKLLIELNGFYKDDERAFVFYEKETFKFYKKISL